MRRAWQFLADTWCYVAHPKPMWPVNGYYRCPHCQRTYPVPWEKGGMNRWNYRQAEANVSPRAVVRPTLEY